MGRVLKQAIPLAVAVLVGVYVGSVLRSYSDASRSAVAFSRARRRAGAVSGYPSDSRPM